MFKPLDRRQKRLFEKNKGLRQKNLKWENELSRKFLQKPYNSQKLVSYRILPLASDANMPPKQRAAKTVNATFTLLSFG